LFQDKPILFQIRSSLPDSNYRSVADY